MEVAYQSESCQERDDTLKLGNLGRVSKRDYLQRCEQSQETTKDNEGPLRLEIAGAVTTLKGFRLQRQEAVWRGMPHRSNDLYMRGCTQLVAWR